MAEGVVALGGALTSHIGAVSVKCQCAACSRGSQAGSAPMGHRRGKSVLPCDCDRGGGTSKGMVR